MKSIEYRSGGKRREREGERERERERESKTTRQKKTTEITADLPSFSHSNHPNQRSRLA